METPAIHHLIDHWLKEDLGRGDLTLVAINEKIVTAKWIAKQSGVFCSGPLVRKIFERLNTEVEVQLLISEGEQFQNGQKILDITGPASVLLAGERTALNIAMHLSGIATATAKLASELKGTGVRLADTRKTTPGLRVLEKYAIRCGGGVNHRMGLDDAAMLKENHIAWSNGIGNSIKALRSQIPWTAKIIVEVETAQQAEESIIEGADGILIDEMSPEDLNHLVPRLRKLSKDLTNVRPSQIIIEASGINPSKIKDYALTGIDLISCSAPITKSTWIDFSMRFDDQTLNQ
ncbi:Quinolinate phosphoribosyltransferase (decarboxylating) [Prochlorococcus sp. MIT 0601]|nr:Quinolinate phosphoribosyltransferase (decarboxylating) [Prochlorococcus sp. MIT 0601]